MDTRDGLLPSRASYPGARSTDGAAPWVIDALLGTAVALAIALIIVTERAGEQSTGLLAYLFAAGFGALMMLRRRMPVVVLGATVLGLFAYYSMGYPAIGVAIPVVAAVFSAAEAGWMLYSIVASVMVLGASIFFRLQEGAPVPYLLGYALVSNVALMAAAVALGDGIRIRRALRHERDETARLTELQSAREADRRVQNERENIARDLHDLVGHTMSVISLHSNVAAEAVGDDDAAARDAVARVQDAAGQTMRELRVTVRVLRTPRGDDAGHTLVSLSDLTGLLDAATDAGIEAEYDVDRVVGQLSPAIDAAAYHVIQEAITNVIRHAHASRVSISTSIEQGILRIAVADNGSGSGDPPGSGHGLAGMSERVRLLGGSMHAQPRPEGGFTVHAEMPARLQP